MIHTGRCKHCGKTFDEHTGSVKFCSDDEWDGDTTSFLDSGLAALDAHKEELYKAAKAFIESHNNSEFAYDLGKWCDVVAKLESILNQIEKEK